MRPKAVGLCCAEFDAVNYQLMQKLYSGPRRCIIYATSSRCSITQISCWTPKNTNHAAQCGQQCRGADILTVMQPELLKLFFSVNDLSSPVSAFHLIDSFCHLSEVTLRGGGMMVLLHNA